MILHEIPDIGSNEYRAFMFLQWDFISCIWSFVGFETNVADKNPGKVDRF
jgi:hypothetical protein